MMDKKSWFAFLDALNIKNANIAIKEINTKFVSKSNKIEKV